MSALKSLAKSLGERLMASPKEAVSVQALADEIATLRAEQHHSQLAMMAVMNQFTQIIGQVNGLVLSGTGIMYRQTGQSPTLGDSLLLLHRRIDALALATPQPAPPAVIVVQPEPRQGSPAPASPVASAGPDHEPTGAAPSATGRRRNVFDEIEKEIEDRIARGGGQ
jgi:hypothetical protein